MKLLLEAGADVNAKDHSGQPPVVYATDHQCLELLLKAGADVNSKDHYGYNLIFRAAQYQRYDCLKLLINAGADVNTIIGQLATPLHALMGPRDNVKSKLQLKSIKLLLQSGASCECFYQVL